MVLQSPEVFLFSSRRRHTRYWRDWSSDVCSSDLQVAGRATAPSGRALAGQPDALAVLDAGRDPHGDRAGLVRDAVAGAGRAGVVDDLAGAAAVAARLREGERPLAAAGHAGALAHRAGVRAGAGLRAATGAGRAGARALHPQGHRHAEDGLVEGERRLGLDVLAAGRAGRRLAARPRRAGPAATAEQTPEQVDRKSTRLNSSHANISYAVFCLKK